MFKKIALGLSAITLALIAVACAGSVAAPSPAATQPVASTPASTPQTVIKATTEKPSGSIKAKIIEAQVSGDSVSIPVSDVESDWNTQFAINAQNTKMNFMAYLLNNKIYVRADVCPPCRSIGYSLDGKILVCDRCATTFKADTGDGIAGACVNYPKALVPYEIVAGNITMKQADLALAYENTIKPGLP